MDTNRSSDVLNQTEGSRAGFMGRMDEWKSRGTELVHRTTSSMSQKAHSFQRNVTASVKPMIHDTMDKADREFHTNPTKWAGIAAGATFVLDMIGRELRHRASRKTRRAMPDLIIIETA